MSSISKLLWPLPPLERQLDSRSVHVWATVLDQSSAQIAAHAATLSLDEHARAARYRFDRDRNRFTVARGWLRTVLGEYLRATPASLQFEYGPQGKPALSSSTSPSSLHFNLAHSGGLALLAVTRVGPVGIDIEEIRPTRETDGIAERFFSAQESAELKALPPAEKPAAFFNLWTRKEAWLKATGDGIGESLSQIEISFQADQPAQLLRLFGDTEAAKQWLLLDLSPASGFTGALALRAPDAHIECWRSPELP